MAADAAAQAPAGQCNILQNQRVERREEFGVPMIYVTGPFEIRCAGGEELRALHGTVNELTREIFLSGNVFFQDPTQTLTSGTATYSASIGRLYATENVVFTNRREGSTLSGPELEYYRAMPGRPDAQVSAGQRPHLTMRPREMRPGSEPLEIDANQIFIQGENQLTATGDVIIRRPDLHATAEEAQFNRVTESLDLRVNARVQSERFDLSGQVVQARMPDGVLEHVHARTDAALVGEDLRVDAHDVQLFFADELLQRAVARMDRAAEHAGRAVATSTTFRLEGDSIDAMTPDQRLDRVVAIGRARGETIDTTAANPLAMSPMGADTTVSEPTEVGALSALIDRDWIVGDTITAFFARADTVPAPEEGRDTAVVLKRLVSQGMAQALYRIRQEGAPPGARQPINYLAGELIELEFEAGELHFAEVEGLRRGIYLDPLPPPATPAAGAQRSGLPRGAAPPATTRR